MIMKDGIKLRVIAQEWADGRAQVVVGLPFPNKRVFGVGECLGDTSSHDSLAIMLRKAQKLAGRRARRALAQETVQAPQAA
ncbi:hypothetical protein KGQ31_01480 [Patescibacteria group bacterium]|nr:hypothetical protein [Patescibacteria group bacterium]